MAALGPDRHADTDFSRAFRDRDEQDVHDADAADKQRDGSNREQHNRERLTGSLLNLSDIDLCFHSEVVALFGLQTMPGPQYLPDLFDGLWQILCTVSRCEHRADRAKEQGPEDFAFGGTERNEYDIVLIRALGGLPFGSQHADHTERHVLDPNLRPDRFLPWIKQIVDDGLAEQRHTSRAVHVTLRKWPATRKRLVTDREITWRNAVDRRVPVPISVHNLHDFALGPTGVGQEWNPFLQIEGIRHRQRDRAALCAAHSTHRRCTRPDDDDIGPHCGNLSLDGLLGPF